MYKNNPMMALIALAMSLGKVFGIGADHESRTTRNRNVGGYSHTYPGKRRNGKRKSGMKARRKMFYRESGVAL